MSSIQSKSYDYLFSIVMAIYNVEEYLDEAIESVVNQTLDFEKHVQLILVNDGSVDNSEKICLKYEKKYPNNIVYLKKENGGVSSARNLGIKYARGKYVNFLDSDDKLSANTLYNVYKFFEINYENIDIVAIPIYFFEGREGPHTLNNKFEKTCIVDIYEKYDYIQMHISSSFIKREVLENYEFNENLSYAEDADLLNRIILLKGKYGLVKEAKYHYRSRINNNSAIQTGPQKKIWYTDNLKYFSLGLINYSLTLLGYVPNYIQYLIMYDLKWRFEVPWIDSSILDPDEYNEFIWYIREVLGYIDDDIILNMRNFNVHKKKFVLQLKYGDKWNDVRQIVYLDEDVKLFVCGKEINSLKEQVTTIDIIEVYENEILIEGMFGSYFNNDDIKIIVKLNDRRFEPEIANREVSNIYSINMLAKEFIGYKIRLPISREDVNKIGIYAVINSLEVKLNLKVNAFSKINSEIENSYYCKNGYILYLKDNHIIVKNKRRFEQLIWEFNLLVGLFRNEDIGSKKAIIVRLMARLYKLFFKNKEIWLFMDRQNKADDNAEHLFKYAVRQKDKIKKIFVITRDCEDYYKLKKVGKVIPYGSYRYKFMYLVADKIISSHADEWVINPFARLKKYYQDLMDFDFIFLQHGIIKDDLSNWLNKYNKNMKLFVTSSYFEYESIVNGDYGYDKDVVKLTGLPRYDNLKNNDCKQILIMPTWRKQLVKPKDPLTGTRPYNLYFKESEYFQKYNQLINDERIIKKAVQLGYKIVFFPHPDMHQQLKDFTKHPMVDFIDYSISIQKLINDSSLLITDYSSVFFDFAFLQKPVLYFHFEKGHWDKGYFDYELMGFGEVCKEYEQLVSYILEYLDNSCEMKPKYIERVEKFYAYTDRNNCERVYNAIREIDKNHEI